MEDITTPREKILKKVRAALLNKFASPIPSVEMESDVFTYADEDHAVAFGKNFTEAGGGFVYSHNFFDFSESLITWMEKRAVRNLMVSDPELKREMENLGLHILETSFEVPEHCAALLSAEALVARNGAVLFSSVSTNRELLAFAPIVVVYAKLSRLGDDMKQAMTLLKNRYGEKLPSLFSFVYGPARMMSPDGSNIRSDGGRQELILFLVNDLA